jgi:ABC-type glycerol-3-phosphate transport system substrate-binding protein
VGYTSLEDAIVEFNLLNADYELVLKDYSNDSTLDQDAMMDQLNQDILNGDGPDILVLREYGFPCNVYAGNGYLADLYPLMAADETFTASDYYENILQTYENQGKLYGLVTSYWVDTVFTSSDYLNVTDGWTPTECQALAAQSDIPLMQGYEVDVDYASRSFATYVLGDGIKDYIDGDTCDFTSGEFAAMLEILKTDYPFNDYDTVADSLLVKNGTVLAGVESIYDITTMLSCAWKYGENYVMTGFPSPNRSRISIHPQGALGIAQTTAYPEVCWEFLKQILAEEDQWILYGFSGMSLKKSVMEEAVSRTTLPADDPDAYSLNMKVGVGDDSVDVTGEPLTQAQAEDFLRILETTKCAMVDTETISIVQEEAASFFSGDKTAQEVAEIIQNRVQLHLWEQS